MGRNNSSSPVVLLVALLLLALLPVLLDQADLLQPSVPAAPEPAAVQSAVPPVSEELAKNLRPIRFAREQSDESINLMREEPVVDAPEKLGARKTHISRKDNARVLRVVFESEPRCMEGDLDIIGKTLKRTDNPRLLLSVESLTDGAGSFPPLAKEISLNDVGPGRSHSFLIPETARQQHIGLFICEDRAQEQQCRGKHAMDLAKLSDEFLPGRAYTSKIDKSFFFQYFVLSDNEVINFDIPPGGSFYSQLGEYLSGRSEGSIAEIVDRVRQLNTALNSMPARVMPREIRINLPRHEQGECQKQGLRLPPELQAALERRGGVVTPR